MTIGKGKWLLERWRCNARAAGPFDAYKGFPEARQSLLYDESKTVKFDKVLAENGRNMWVLAMPG